MSKETRFGLIFAILGIIIAVLQMMFPQIPPYIGWPIVGILVILAIGLFVFGRKNKSKRPLTKDERQYLSRLSKELQDYSSYYQQLADNTNIKKVNTGKIKEIGNQIIVYMGLKKISFSKPPKKSEFYKAIFILFYDLFKLMYIYHIKVRFNLGYRMKLFIDIGLIPDKVGIGLSAHDNKGKELTKNLLRVTGERISLNETITAILQCKDICYSMNNVYLWLLMYPRAYKKSRFHFGEIIKLMYGLREKIMTYSFAEVNKAVIKEFMGD